MKKQKLKKSTVAIVATLALASTAMTSYAATETFSHYMRDGSTEWKDVDDQTKSSGYLYTYVMITSAKYGEAATAFRACSTSSKTNLSNQAIEINNQDRTPHLIPYTTDVGVPYVGSVTLQTHAAGTWTSYYTVTGEWNANANLSFGN